MGIRLFRFYNEMQEEGVILYFNGPVSQGVVEGLTELIRSKMCVEDAGTGAVHRVFSILVEQMQNVVRYSVERDVPSGACGGEVAHGQVVVGREKDGHFFVACGNKIRATDTPKLRERIETLRKMNKDELKAYYKEQRKLGKRTAKGAGLGLIEMARKATRPLEFDVVEVDEETSFFSMKVVA